ncbi:MAG: glycosyltransferase [Planctomycetota bacterium]
MNEAEGQPGVSVIIPVHNGGAALRECLASVAGADPAPVETIVVADGGGASDRNAGEEFGARVLVVPEQRGPAAARNLGVQAAVGDIVFFIDADVAVPPDTIAKVAQAFAGEPRVAAVFGSYDDAPARPNFLSQYKNLAHHYIHQTANEDASTFWSGCGAVRRETFLEMGGFDENYGSPCIEDIELGYRLRQAGYEIRLCKALQVKHLKEWRAAGLLKAEVFYRAVPWTELILHHRRLTNDLNLRLSGRVSVVAAYSALIALAAALIWPRALFVAGALALLLLAVNAPLYVFFRRKRGPWFALAAIPWNWFYYFYGGLGFAIGVLRCLLGRGQGPLRRRGPT